MIYRTKTYIAGDWTGDNNIIQQLYKWNNSDYWALSFDDAHELTQARDTSKYCSIKRSLWTRLESSHTFILIVGDATLRLTKGSCQYCDSYYNYRCYRGGYVDFRSYIDYECAKAVYDKMKIIVIYNYAKVYKEKCPLILRNKGIHIPAYYYKDDGYKYNYELIKKAISG